MSTRPVKEERRARATDLPSYAVLQIDHILGERSTLHFPCTQYQNDIIGFACDVMGFVACRTLAELEAIRDDEEARGVPEHEQQKCLWPKQIEILEAIMRGERVSVASGHKISKSHTAGIAGLWFYSCFDDAKVIYSSTTYHQVQTILWDEFRKLRYRSKVAIPGDMHEMARSGFVSIDFRSARGFTSKEPEAIAGISGKNLLFLLDEASGIPDAIFEAIEGNRAGGAKIVMFSNPTRTSGVFFESHNAKSAFYTCFQVSSEETPNAVTGRRLIPGLATKAFVDQMREEWGEDSPWYKVRVKGLFCINEDGKPFSLDLLAAAEVRWNDEPAEGRLHIGCDPAGAGDGGDETGFAVRRGKKVICVYARRGLSKEAIVEELRGLLATYSVPADNGDMCPIIAIDREGPIGFDVWLQARAAFDKAMVLGERASDKAFRRPDLYNLHRDELWGALEAFLRDGGAIPTDTKLEKELLTIEWTSNLRNKLQATSKDDIRKLIQRSPDRADALCLCVWVPTNYASRPAQEEQQAPPQHDPYKDPRARGMDPYAAMDPWGPSR